MSFGQVRARETRHDLLFPANGAPAPIPSRTIHSTASRIASIEYRPGEWPSAKLMLAVTPATETDLRTDHMTLQQCLQCPRRDLPARLQPQIKSALAVPRARVPVLGLLGSQGRFIARQQVVAAVNLEILRGGGRRGQIANGRDHDHRS